MARHPVRAHDRIEIQDEHPLAGAPALDSLWMDPAVLVLDKPAGLEVQGPRGVEALLRTQFSDSGIAAVHRLDRDTTGCLLFARTDEIRHRLIEQFRNRTVRKVYRAVVGGRLDTATRTIRRSIEGKSAITKIRVIQATPDASYLSVQIETGRTHQIRKHLADIGHAVLGDPHYATGRQPNGRLREVPRPLLHAQAIHFQHPVSGNDIRVRAPLPEDFQQWLHTLRLGNKD